LQSLSIGSAVSYDSDEVQLAVEILDVLKVMQTHIGAVLYAPQNTYGHNATEISTENNISLYAGLQLLKSVLTKLGDPSGKIPLINDLLSGIESYMKNYAFDSQTFVLQQGGTIDASGAFVAATTFATDVNTWGMSVFGKAFDQWYGHGSAYKIWQNTKSHTGVFKNGDQSTITGVGYTDTHDITSVEWTLGAVNMAKILAQQYSTSDPSLSADLLKDAGNMRDGMESLKEAIDGSSVAYKYSDVRYYIPFGWFANPIPALTSTAWIVFVDANYNPFYSSGEFLQFDTVSANVDFFAAQ